MEFIRRDAVFYDVSNLGEQDIISNDSEISLVSEKLFVTFCTGNIEKDIVSGIGCVGIRRRKERNPSEKKKLSLLSVIELL